MAFFERARGFVRPQPAWSALLLAALLLVNVPSWNHDTLSRGWYKRFESFEKYFATTSWLDAFWTGTSKFARHLAGTRGRLLR